MDRDCNHTFHHLDRYNQPIGSWTEVQVIDERFGKRIKVVCSYCGRFYGYKVRSAKEEKYVRSGV